MKIIFEEPVSGEQEEIIIRCHNVDDDIMRLVSALRDGKNKLSGYSEDGISPLSVKDIFYFDTVDNKVFAYTSDKVYEIRLKLYEVESKYENTDLLRISKSTIVNISKIAHLTPRLNGRFDAVMKNGETVIISRQYVNLLKEKLGI